MHHHFLQARASIRFVSPVELSPYFSKLLRSKTAEPWTTLPGGSTLVVRASKFKVSQAQAVRSGSAATVTLPFLSNSRARRS